MCGNQAKSTCLTPPADGFIYIDFLVLRVWVEPGPGGCLVRLFYLLKHRDQQAPLCPDQITVASCWKKGGHGPDLRLPRALQGSTRLPTASHGSSRLPIRAAVSFAYVAVTGDVLSLSLWEEWRSNYVWGPGTRLQVCVRAF